MAGVTAAFGVKRTCRSCRSMSAFGGEADNICSLWAFRFWPKADISGPLLLRCTAPTCYIILWSSALGVSPWGDASSSRCSRRGAHMVHPQVIARVP